MPSGTESKPSWDFLELTTAPIKRNLNRADLYEEALGRGEGRLTNGGALLCTTGAHTGRSPNDKFIVKEPSSDAEISWGGPNRPMSVEHFEQLDQDMQRHAAALPLYVQDCYGGADATHRLPVRIVTEFAWHSLFIRSLLIPRAADDKAFAPQWTIIDLPSFRADPTRHGSRSETMIALNFATRRVLIAGTSYAGEMKKSVFSILNYLLPFAGVLPMHCSANIGSGGDTALFFGLSGTGKTTLSSDPDRALIGDDEHGWSERGVFNFEGGCYAKTIRLSQTSEPQIYATTQRFGTVLENVTMLSGTRALDFDDASVTENTRAAYPLEFIDNAVPSGQGGHPRNIVMLTADAFGVLPPICRLSSAGAMYHFLSGYTAKVAGTERGVTEPSATFSACFGAPFLPLAPGRYAAMLGQLIERHQAKVWLVNTGWTGGGYGVGERFRIAQTRAMIRAALGGQLDAVSYRHDTRFNLDVPESCPDVPTDILNPRGTWKDQAAYDAQADKLAKMFVDNARKFSGVSAEILAAGPAAK